MPAKFPSLVDEMTSNSAASATSAYQPAPRRASTKPAKSVYVMPRNCLDGMPDMAPKSVSLILTDPPYFIDGMDDKWDHAKLRSRVKKGVIGGIPVGMKFTPEQGRNLYKFLLPVAREWARIIKPGGFVLCFSQPRLAHRMAAAIEDAGFEIRDLLAWRYEGQAKAFTQAHFVRRSALPETEKRRIIAALDGRKTPQLKPQMESIILAQAPREGTYVDNWLEHEVGLVDLSNPVLEPGKCPGTIIAAKKPRRRYGHMTAKPVALLRHLVRIFTTRGHQSLVFDPFAGSGSTGEAALLEERSFFGFEADPAMARIAERRVAAAGNSA